MTDLKNNLEEVLEINPMNNKKYIEAVSFRDWQRCDLICDEHTVLVDRIKNLEKDLDLALNALQRESEENEKLKQELAQAKKEADTLNTDWCKCTSLNGQLNIQNRKLEQELQKTRERLEFAESALLKIKRRPFDDKTHIRMIEDQKKFINEILNISYEYFMVKLQDANNKGISVPAMFKQEKDKQGK